MLASDCEIKGRMLEMILQESKLEGAHIHMFDEMPEDFPLFYFLM